MGSSPATMVSVSKWRRGVIRSVALPFLVDFVVVFRYITRCQIAVMNLMRTQRDVDCLSSRRITGRINLCYRIILIIPITVTMILIMTII